MSLRYLLWLVCVASICTSSVVSAQDPVFGQFYTAPTSLNPALCGVFEGQFRANANYRVQWQSVMPSTPFRTIGASMEYKQKVLRGDYAAISVNALHDQAGESSFTLNRAYLGASYLKQLSGNRYRTSNQYLVAGAQLGFGQHTLSYNDLWFSSQFDQGTVEVNNRLPTGENLLNDKAGTYLDFNAGLLWYAIFDKNLSLYAGAALNHLSAPNISFFENREEKLKQRWVGHVGGELPFNKNLSLLPAVMVTGQGTAMTSILGGNLRYTNKDWKEVALRTGMWGQISNRLTDKVLLNSLIFSAILELNRLNIGISYDVNTSVVSDLSNGRGAFELSVIYTHPSQYRERVHCPKL